MRITELTATPFAPVHPFLPTTATAAPRPGQAATWTANERFSFHTNLETSQARVSGIGRFDADAAFLRFDLDFASQRRTVDDTGEHWESLKFSLHVEAASFTLRQDAAPGPAQQSADLSGFCERLHARLAQWGCEGRTSDGAQEDPILNRDLLQLAQLLIMSGQDSDQVRQRLARMARMNEDMQGASQAKVQLRADPRSVRVETPKPVRPPQTGETAAGPPPPAEAPPDPVAHELLAAAMREHPEWNDAKESAWKARQALGERLKIDDLEKQTGVKFTGSRDWAHQPFPLHYIQKARLALNEGCVERAKEEMANANRTPGFQVCDPVVLDLDGGGLTLGGRRAIDLDGTGAQAHQWAGAGDGILFVDLDGDRQVTGGRELLGTQAFDGAIAAFTDGMGKLRTLDTNGDGWLVGDELASLSVAVGGGTVDKIYSLSDLGVDRMALGQGAGPLTFWREGEARQGIDVSL